MIPTIVVVLLGVGGEGLQLHRRTLGCIRDSGAFVHRKKIDEGSRVWDMYGSTVHTHTHTKVFKTTKSS